MMSAGGLKHLKKMKTIAGNHAEVGRIKRNREESTMHLKRKQEEVENEKLKKRKQLEARIQRRKSKRSISAKNKGKKGDKVGKTKVAVNPEQITKKKETEDEVRESMKQFKHYRAKAIYAKKTGDMASAMSILKTCHSLKVSIKQKMKEIESSENSND